MSRPANGQGYESMIYGLYFDTTIDGNSAMDEVTDAAKEAIDRIPDNIQLSDKPIVEAARAAYDKIATETQKALISDLRIKLEQAEKRISDLEYIENNNESEEDTTVGEQGTDDTQNTETKNGCKGDIATTGIAMVLVLVSSMAFVIVRRKKAYEL